MSLTEEQLWSTYAAAAIMGGHRYADAIDQIATEAVALHRRRFPGESPGAAKAFATSRPPALQPDTPDPSEKPAKGKESRL